MFTKLSRNPISFFSSNKPPFFVEAKIDGEDLILVRKFDGEVYALNRYGRVYSSLPFFKQLPDEPFVARGEMFCGGGLSGQLYGLKRAVRDGVVEVAIHDILYFKGVDLRGAPLSERRSFLSCFPLSLKPLGLVYCVDEVEALFKRAVSEGFEGVVVKPASSLYRDYAWLKVKRFETYEVLLTARRRGRRSFRMEAEGRHVGDVSSGVSPREAEVLASMPIERVDGEYEYFKQPIPALVEGQEFTGCKIRHPRLIRFLTA